MVVATRLWLRLFAVFGLFFFFLCCCLTSDFAFAVCCVYLPVSHREHQSLRCPAMVQLGVLWSVMTSLATEHSHGPPGLRSTVCDDMFAVTQPDYVPAGWSGICISLTYPNFSFSLSRFVPISIYPCGPKLGYQPTGCVLLSNQRGTILVPCI